MDHRNQSYPVHGQRSMASEVAFRSDFQFSFRPKMSTELETTLFLDNIRKNFIQGYMVGPVFFDLSKAFDTISNSRLVAKLHSCDLNGAELELFTS